MDMKQFEYFLTISRANFNITKAADELMISQPALSKMIAAIETELDLELFVRKKGRLSGHTLAGEIFAEHAVDMIYNYRQMMRRLEAYSTHSKNYLDKVSIGITASVRMALFTDVFLKSIYDFPHIGLDIIELEAIELERCFKENEIDLLISIVRDNPQPNYVKSDIVWTEPFVAILGQTNPLAVRKTLFWSDFADVNLALPGKKYISQELVTKRLYREGIHPKIVINSTSSNFLIQSTINNDVVAILPKVFYESCKEEIPDTVYLPIEEMLCWNVAISMQSNRSNIHPTSQIYNTFLEYFRMKR